jgi:hypothetical protein
METDSLQWMVLSALLSAYPATVRVEELRAMQPDADIEESIARLLIDGLAIRFGEWVKASQPAARFDELSKPAPPAPNQLKVAS